MVMQRPLSAAVLAASLLVIPTSIRAGTPEDLARARALLTREDGRAAAALLEAALPAATAELRAQVLRELRRAYELAATQAEAAGRDREAEAYRDNLRILTRTPRPKSTAEAGLPPAPQPPARLREPEHVTQTQPKDKDEASSSAPPGGISAPPAAANLPKAPTADPTVSAVAAADAAFRAARYDEAGRLYAALAENEKLPASRRDHWAYCRCVDVVRRINAKPATATDWERVHAEIRAIRALSPQNWFGEYLRNLAAQRAAGAPKGDPRLLVVRGSSPEDGPAAAASPAGRRPSESPVAPTQRVAPTAAPAATTEPGPRGGVGQVAPNLGNWQVYVTPNFRILHADAALAGRVAGVAEACREEQARRWAGAGPRAPWAPRCDIYLYPTATVFSQMTGQPEDSPGFSTMGLNSGKVVARRVNLRADHPNLVTAIVPHEVTHVVLADLFTTQQIPRWADEGIAVLSEPPSEQQLRAEDLSEPLAANRLFKIETLMAADYPDGRYWSLFYAQSVSLTRFLVEQGSPAQFVQFLQAAQRNGIEPELRRLYRIDGYADLQNRWLSYARAATAPKTASAADPASPATERR
jgi:hypothetical protein